MGTKMTEVYWDIGENGDLIIVATSGDDDSYNEDVFCLDDVSDELETSIWLGEDTAEWLLLANNLMNISTFIMERLSK